MNSTTTVTGPDVQDCPFPAEADNHRPVKSTLRPLNASERLPPHSMEAEQGILGCVLLGGDSMGQCIEELPMGVMSFYDLRHQQLFETMSEMYQEQVPIDAITVQQKLRDQGQLEAVGGLSYLFKLTEAVPSATHIGHYIGIVAEKAMLRDIVRVCTGCVARLYDHEDEPRGVLEGLERDVMKIGTACSVGGVKPIKDLVHGAINAIEDCHQKGKMLSGLSTGFIDFDKMTRGLKGNEFIVIAGRPSMGKSSIAMNMVEHIAIDQGQAVGVFSLEMSAESLVLRMLCSRSRVNLNNLQDGFLPDRYFPKITGAAGQLAKAPIFIDDTASMTVMQLRAKSHRMVAQYRIKLIVIDYIQLVKPSRSDGKMDRNREIGEISAGIKALSKELNIPVIALSQLNRDVEREKNRKPKLSDLRDSGSIEQDADIVCMLYKPNEHAEDGELSRVFEAVPINLLIAKQRNGPTGDVHLTFLKGYTRFESAAKVSNEDVPPDDQYTMPYQES